MVSFSMFGCIPENARRKKKTHPSTTGIDQKPTTTIETYRNPSHKPTASHLDPPQVKPSLESTKNPSRNPPRPTAQNQESSTKSTKPNQLQPTSNT